MLSMEDITLINGDFLREEFFFIYLDHLKAIYGHDATAMGTCSIGYDIAIWWCELAKLFLGVKWLWKKSYLV